MKRKIICLVLSLIFVFGIFGANGTYAWFVEFRGGSDIQSLHNLRSGNIGFTLYGDFRDSSELGTIQPGPIEFEGNTNPYELLTTLSLPEEITSNIDFDAELYSGYNMLIATTSSVASEIRFKVFYTYPVPVAEGTEGAVDGYLLEQVSAVGDTSPMYADFDESLWSYSSDDYFTYNGEIPAVGDGEAPKLIPIFKSLYYNGNYSDLPTSVFKDSNNFTVQIQFQAKQANFAEWEDIGELTFIVGSSESATEATSTSPSGEAS